jgi:AcrR family transcriptional regulator
MNKVEQTKAERTKERILQAATDEFAAYGIAGGRIDRIAGAAKANKSLIYDYFGSKEELFTAVLARHLAHVYQTVRFTADDLPGYAARLFDFAMDHPSLMRLAMWNGLEQRRDWPLDEGSSLDAQVVAIGQAQADGIVTGSYPPEFLLTLVITLASAWTAANPFGISIAPDATSRRTSLRTAISNAVKQICQPLEDTTKKTAKKSITGSRPKKRIAV